MSLLDFFVMAIGVGVALSIAVAILTLDTIVDWFRERLGNRRTSSYLAVTVLKNLKRGDYQVVQGVFDTTTDSFVCKRTVKASQIDADFLAAHNEEGVAVWSV